MIDATSAATYAAIVTVSLTIGYWAGARRAFRDSSSGRTSESESNGQRGFSTTDEAPNVDSDSSDVEPGEDLASIKASMLEDYKLVGAIVSYLR